ncbi:MAG: YraN family protein [Phycisphaerales bacterium]
MLRLLTRLLRPAPRDDRELGRLGERHAARLLRRAGYTVLGRNIRVPAGEADLVCLAPDRATIVIVEVKTRRPGAATSAQGSAVPPEASIHRGKQRKLLEVARSLSRANGWEGRAVRIDIVAIDWQEGQRPPVVRHFVDAMVGG